MNDLSEAIETINGILAMLDEQPIDIDATAPVVAQYNQLYDKYLERYFNKMPEARKVYEKTGLVNDIGYQYLMGIKSKLNA